MLITELIQKASPLRRELKTVYDRLPATRCLRQTRCCSLLPEMTFLEALQVIGEMALWMPSDRKTLLKKMARTFFCNATEINPCPFLEKSDCLIYPDRFFACRAYGLWSGNYYQELAERNRRGKLFLQHQWENLGVSLPEEVLSFQVPYCSRVETEPPAGITDEELSAASDKIDRLSGDLGFQDREFRETYFSDLSFFLTGRQFGLREAVRLKFFIVRDIIQKGDRSRLDHTLNRVTDQLFEQQLKE